MSLYKKALHLAALIRLFLHVSSQGGGNLPEKGPVILCCNHRSNIDPVVVGSVLRRPLFFMAKYELFKIPVFRRLIRALGAFPVKRGMGDTEAIKKSLQVLRDGEVLAMFPEGHRQKLYGPPKKFESGAVRIALKTGAMLLPAAIICKKPVGLFNRKFVRVGSPVTVQELGLTDSSPEALRQASEKLRQMVAALMEEQP